MCGIAGIYAFAGSPVLESAVATILDQLTHRGRDAAAIEINERISATAKIGLGHRRLSIIGLEATGTQPLFYANRQLCITYNGEIYNYRLIRRFLEKNSYTFDTQTDTEVLLAAYHYWGEDCVKHLNGMFAFAIWDEARKKLFCARDPLGIKPFYYHLSAREFAFASEALALAHYTSADLDSSAVMTYLLSMYVATADSIFTGIQKLAPGCTLTVSTSGDIHIQKFWRIEQFQGVVSDEHSLDALRSHIDKAIQNQCQSDVPVGGFLSGGIDSGLITALAAPRCQKYFTYSAGYEGLDNNELAQARQIAATYQTQHAELMITASDAMSALDAALHHLSEPIADPSIVATYLLAQMAARDGVKVLLNGTGGDEVFGGYTRYTGQLSPQRRLLALIPPIVKKSLSQLPLSPKLKSRLQSVSLDMLFSTGGSYGLAKQLAGSTILPFLQQLGRRFSSLTSSKIPVLYQKMLFDLQVYLPDQLLFLLDQMTMAHTIEGRVPLLDVDVIRCAFQFESSEHLRHGQTKALLKTIALPHLGQAHIERKKQGFAGSSGWWVKQNFARFKEGIAELRSLPLFENFPIDRLLEDKHCTAAQTNDIFILYCFSQWYARVKPLLSRG